MKTGDRILAGILIFLSIFVFVETSKFPKYELRGIKLPGPTFFPNLLAIFLLIAAGYLIINSFLVQESKSTQTRVSRWGIFNIAFLVLMIIIFTYIVNYLGFLTSMFLISLALFLKFRVNWFKALLHSAIISFLVFFVFQQLFKVPFPVNLWGF